MSRKYLIVELLILNLTLLILIILLSFTIYCSKKSTMYDDFVESLFTSTSSSINVSEDIKEQFASEVSGVLSILPCLSRQVVIKHSGVSYEEDKTKYLSVCEVNYVYENGVTITYTIIIHCVFNKDNTLISVSMKLWKNNAEGL